MKDSFPLKSIITVLVIVAVYSFVFTAVGNVGGNRNEISQPVGESSVRIANEYRAGNIRINSPLQTTTAPEREYAAYVVATWQKVTVDDAYYRNLTLTTTPAPVVTAAETTTSTALVTSIVQTETPPAVVTDTSTAGSGDTDTSAYGEGFTFITYGYGHGCGLSQNGANYLANYGGYDYTQILSTFYTGATLANTGITGNETITVNGVSGRVVDMIAMVCNQEVGPGFHIEAIKAQAVAAYTFVMYNGGSCTGVGMKANPNEKIYEAVNAVLGQALFYDGKYCLAQFYASSGGASASCKDVFTADIPYLRSVDCPYDAQYDRYYGLEVKFTAEKLKSTLESQLGIKLSANPENWIKVNVGDGGYIASVVIDGQVTVKGYTFRRYLGLKSAKFELYYNSGEPVAESGEAVPADASAAESAAE